jgi:DNA mismatch repair ATPase MutL
LDQIWVEDDGSGISKEDLKLAGVRYATSKLKKYDDLKV